MRKFVSAVSFVETFVDFLGECEGIQKSILAGGSFAGYNRTYQWTGSSCFQTFFCQIFLECVNIFIGDALYLHGLTGSECKNAVSEFFSGFCKTALLGGGYFAYCDENALYAKEYSDANSSRILRLDLTTGEWSALPLNLGEQVLGVNGHRFLTSRLLTDAPLPDYNDYEAYNAALQNARSELVWLDPATMQREKICETERLDGSTIYVKIYNDRVYVQDNPQERSEYGTSYSLSCYSKDHQHTVLIDTLPMNLYLPSTDNGFMPMFGSEERGWIWAQDYTGNGEINYLIDLDTGEMHTMTQTQYRDGMYMGVSLMAQTNDGRWMVGYKPHSNTHNDRCDYGFIDPQEFWNGGENYTPVQMWD